MESKSKKIAHILCIDDDDKIRQLISKFLIKNNFIVSSAENPLLAEKLINFFKFDLLVLDIMMPKIDGITFLEAFRKKNPRLPVLMLSALSNIDKKIITYKKGCDDYLVKPFEPMELILRINKLLNPRINSKINEIIRFGEFDYDLNLQELRKNKKIIKLTHSENLILNFLAQNINSTISRDKISKKIGIDGNSRSVDVFITRLRKKILNLDGTSFIKTSRNEGYILKSDFNV